MIHKSSSGNSVLFFPGLIRFNKHDKLNSLFCIYGQDGVLKEGYIGMNIFSNVKEYKVSKNGKVILGEFKVYKIES